MNKAAVSNCSENASLVQTVNPKHYGSDVCILLCYGNFSLNNNLSSITSIPEWRIHQHYVVPLKAEVHERKSPHGIVREKLPLEPLTVLGLLGVLPQRLDHLDFRLPEKLVIGDVG